MQKRRCGLSPPLPARRAAFSVTGTNTLPPEFAWRIAAVARATLFAEQILFRRTNFIRATNCLACRCALPASAYCLAGPSCAAKRDAHKFAQIHCCNFAWLPELCEGVNDLFERVLRGERPQYIHLAAARSGETSRAAFNQLRLQRIGFVAHVPFAALSELTEVLGAPEL